MPIVDDIVLKFDTLWYNVVYMFTSAHWGLMRGVFMMGYTVQLLTGWIATEAFSPLIQQTNNSLKIAVSLAFVLALIVLGVTYMLASIVRLDIVSPRSAILWYFAGLLFFAIGPSLYQGMNDFRLSISSAFYTSVLSSVQGSTNSTFSSLNSVQTPDLGILTPCDNFGPYLGHPGGHGLPLTISGLDVALAYLRADGIDVMGYAYPMADSCQPHVPAQSFPIPWEWQRPDSYFDNTKTPPFFPDMTTEQRQQAITTAGSSQWRLFSAWPLVWFGVFEQITGMCLAIAQGLTFISFACAVLFAFFKRTEGIAWSVIDQWTSLIVQTVIIAMLQALVVSFFLAGAATSKGLVVVGVGLICLVFMGILLLSGIKAIWGSFNGLFEAMSKATGGVFVTPGAAAQTAVTAAGAAVTGGASLAASGLSMGGNVLGGASALANGASWSQAAGIAFGGSQTVTNAARTLTRLPGLRDSELAETADHFVEGATTRQVARNVPLVGRVSGPVAGAMLLSNRNPDAAYEDEEGRIRQPMLVPAVGSAIAGLTRGPTWPRNDDPAQTAGIPELASPERIGRFTPILPVSDPTTAPMGSSSPDMTTAQRSDYVAQENEEEMEQHISETLRPTPSTSVSNADAAHLEGASSRLERAADTLERAGRQQQFGQHEGHLSLTGAPNVANVMGDIIALLQAQKGSDSLKGVDNFTVGNTMAQALGVTPIDDGKPPIETDLTRFGLFANQALTMAVSPEQAERVVREVKETPEARLLPHTRNELVDGLHTERNLSWADANSEVDRLEHSARLLPNEITAHGVMNVPTAATIQVQPHIDIRPDVQVSVEANTREGQSVVVGGNRAMAGSDALFAGETEGGQ